MIRTLCLVFSFLVFSTACSPPSRAPNSKDDRSIAEILQNPYVHSVSRYPSSYYRIKADVTVVKTGESVPFDFVVACGGIYTSYTYTSGSGFRTHAPQVMMMATESGEAIGLQTPNLCGWDLSKTYDHYTEGEGYTTRQVIPDDFLPYMLWYPDVNDISYAISMASEQAYTGPNPLLRIASTEISYATQEEWDEWREQAFEAYTQTGAMPGPWGMQIPSYIGSDDEEDARLKALNNGRWPAIPFRCWGMKRLNLSGDVKTEFEKYIEPNVGQLVPFTSTNAFFPFQRPTLADNDEEAENLREFLTDIGDNGLSGREKSGPFGRLSGGDYRSFIGSEEEMYGVPRQDTAGGRIWYPKSVSAGRISGDIFIETYPVEQKVVFPTETFDPDNLPQRLYYIQTDAELAGYNVCGTTRITLNDLKDYLQGQRETLAPDRSSRAQIEDWEAMREPDWAVRATEKYPDRYAFERRRLYRPPIWEEWRQIIYLDDEEYEFLSPPINGECALGCFHRDGWLIDFRFNMGKD